jgi:hypothetical protein
MPGNLIGSTPNGVMPASLCTQFTELREYAQLQNQFHDGTIQRSQLYSAESSDELSRLLSRNVRRQVCASDLHAKSTLDHAIAAELLKTVGTQQEPSGDISELGLIAAALASINSGPEPEEWNCPGNASNCASVQDLAKELTTEIETDIETRFRGHPSNKKWSTNNPMFYSNRLTIPGYPGPT